MIANIFSIVVSVVIVATCQYTSAWMPPTGTRSRGMLPIPISCVSPQKSSSSTTLNAEKLEASAGDADETNSEDDVDSKPAVEWGVSYIGGDPCGSKYNTDPFDKNPSNKPGLPDDMKARIEALAQKKLQEYRERENQ